MFRKDKSSGIDSRISDFVKDGSACWIAILATTILFEWITIMLETRSGFADGVKEGAARAVLRDAWQHGHESVELRRDGRRIIFFCTLCSTRCYSDAALSDHLKGNQHSRRVLAASGSTPFLALMGKSCSSNLQTSQIAGNLGETEQSANLCSKKATKDPLVLSMFGVEANSAGECPPPSLERIGSGQVLLREAQSEPSRQVKAVWCQWLGRNSAEATDPQKLESSEAYSVVIFPYSDAIGRSGTWKPNYMIENIATQSREKPQQSKFWKKETKSIELISKPAFDRLVKDGLSSRLNKQLTEKESERGGLFLSKDLSQRALRKVLKKQRLNTMERLCFICHQQMLPGKDVAALLNPKTGQMMCSSRNKRGAFHIFHTLCLIDWILLCQAKFWSAPSVGSKSEVRRMRGQINVKRQKGGSKVTAGSDGHMFCPVCQGTGAKFQGNQLEQPRYRLAQVFEWILELIQARRSWMNHPEQHKSNTGLLFLSDSDGGGKILPVGCVHFYAAGGLDFLTATALKKVPFISEIGM